MLKKLIERLRPPIHLTVNVIQNDDSTVEHDNRVSELLNHNSAQLEQNRALKTALRSYQQIADEMEDLLIQHSASTGYCGCDLEFRHMQAAKLAKEII